MRPFKSLIEVISPEMVISSSVFSGSVQAPRNAAKKIKLIAISDFLINRFISLF